MFDQINPGFLANFIQAIGILVIASLLYPMTRAMKVPYLDYWANGWKSLAIALIALFLYFELTRRQESPTPLPSYLTTPFLIVYCLGEYVFGFLLWRGCRSFGEMSQLRFTDWVILLPAGLFGIFAPVYLQNIEAIFPFHAIVLAMFFLMAFVALGQAQFGPFMPKTGYRVMRIMLGGLTVLFVHYGLVFGYFLYWQPGPVPRYLVYSSYYDVLLETALAFGMIVLWADKMRESLELKNQDLAKAASEMAQAARTDTLTGLLNRRGLEELIKSPNCPTQGCLAVIDLNDLKPLNDRYGHATGDAALQVVARSLRLHFRVTDTLIRLGGDEFLVVIPGWSDQELANRLKDVENSLRSIRLPEVPTSVDLVIAWGIAMFGDSASLFDALQLADQRMYDSKRSLKA